MNIKKDDNIIILTFCVISNVMHDVIKWTLFRLKSHCD